MGIIEALIACIFLGFACAYPVCIMLLNFKGGPFTTVNFFVYNNNNEQTAWEVNLFDRIRSLFNVYNIYEGYWEVKHNNWSQLFSCPYCLSFWFAFPFSLFITSVSGQHIWFPIFHLIIVTFSVIMNRWGI